MTVQEFIERARKVHGNKYDYSKVVYVNNKTKVCIICPIHGEFWVMPGHHLRGVGCPHCKESKLEREIREFLKTKGIKFMAKHSFDWLGKQHLDFYLEDYNTAIECQGEQHFYPVDYFGGDEKFDKTVERDNRKRRLCDGNNVKLLYFSDKKYTEEIITDKEILLTEILKTHDS